MPSALAMTTGSPPSSTATQELVVPRSIPIILPIIVILLNRLACYKLTFTMHSRMIRPFMVYPFCSTAVTVPGSSPSAASACITA